jgi:PAS domain S-box-containing protein
VQNHQEAPIKDQNKSKVQLIDELAQLRRQVADLAESKARGERANETLLESHAHIISMVDAATDAIISVDEDQQIIIFNQGAERIFGYSVDEIAGQTLDMLLPERLRVVHHQHIKDFAESDVTARLMGERQEILGRRKNGQEFPAEASISKLEVAGKQFFTVVLRDITNRKRAELEREKLIDQLQALNKAAQAITSELSLEHVLRKIAEAAQDLIQARYAALGVHDGHGKLIRFITVGIEPQTYDKIGPLPIGRGLLGALLHQGQSLIINDMANHPEAVGFPVHHPAMRSLLGVPIFSKATLIGAFYLADKTDGSDFTEIDQKLIEMLAYHAAIAIENARLYKQTQRLAILEERDRFARDLHDGIIQSTYGVGLSLENVKAAIDPQNQEAAAMIDQALNSMAQMITELRNYIFDLRPQALKDKGLLVRLEGLVKELRINTILTIGATLDPEINAYLNDEQASHIFHIAHEALANVVRHAKARKASLSLTGDGDHVILKIEDDGVGFEPPAQVSHGHHGLANIQERAALLAADLTIDSTPGQGTCLTLTLNVSEHVEVS